MKDYQFKAVIFDLDGVITKTALVHSAAWKKMFDEYLQERAQKLNEPFIEFTHTGDYLPYVDGKPRYKGVQSFLESRGITLPMGEPTDAAGYNSVCALGNRKNDAFNEVLERDGVEVYQSTVNLIYELRRNNIRVGVASSSKNCEEVLRKAGILNLFETRVDGVVSAEMGLKGKPEPDIFTVAAKNLGVEVYESVVVEDAVSGVQAGNKGNFGLVLGIAREENEQELLANGADWVVKDLEELNGIEGLEDWFTKGLLDDNWSITYHDYDPSREKLRESLLAVGNGYFGTRGALEECKSGKNNYPGTYMAGVYNTLSSPVGDRMVDNEDFVNCVNWLPFQLSINNGEWFDPNKAKIVSIYRKLDFRNGLLKRKLTFEHDGLVTTIQSERIAAMHQPNLAGQRYQVIPENYSGTLKIRAGIDANLINEGVERYKQLNQQHLSVLHQESAGNTGLVVTETTQSKIKIAAAYRLKAKLNKQTVSTEFVGVVDSGQSFSEIYLEVQVGETLTVEKLVALCHSNSSGNQSPDIFALEILGKAESFGQLLENSTVAWHKIWEKADIVLTGDRLAQKLLRLHLYHLYVTTSPHNVQIDAGIPARGLHGEAYRGHIFWDELYILPVINLSYPEIAKSILMYRYRRLNEARKYAREYGYRGAMFPWQSGSIGKEETQVVHLNPISGEWGDDYSSLQRHVSLAIAYNVWEYFHATNDVSFMQNYGAELFLDICMFWTGKCEKDGNTGKYHIANVMGPDEFHEKYHDKEEGGLTDNAYTNLMTAWMLEKAFLLRDTLSNEDFKKIAAKIGLELSEMDRWKDISKNLNLIISDDGIIAQYDGYFALKELDWDFFRKKYGNVYRMDRLLKAEGMSPDDFKVAKQADTLMTYYNLNEDEVTQLLNQLGYKLPDDYLNRNLAYYLARTSHGSTLSRVVHAKLANMIGDTKLGWDLYQGALSSDFNDIQGGTTAEGIHAGVMAGTVWIALSVYAGLNLRKQEVHLNPSMPSAWNSLKFNFQFKNVRYYVEVNHSQVIVTAGADAESEIYVWINGVKFLCEPGTPVTVVYQN